MKKSLIAFAATAFIATGCASTSGSPAMSSSSAPLPSMMEETTVEVHNHNWSDMVVYAVRDNSRVRLGMVTSMNTRRFQLPTSFRVSASDLRLMANPIGSQDEYTTSPIQVNPGQRVELRLENMLSISNWAVW